VDVGLGPVLLVGFGGAAAVGPDARLRFLGTCWDLTLNGKPERPDDVSHVIVGELAGRLSGIVNDGRDPGECLAK
jgi:hypothetical protein